MEYGPYIEFYAKLKKEGKPTPLDIKLDNSILTQWFISNFYALSDSRSSNGFGPNPISITDIISFFSIKKPILDLELSVRIIQHIDKKFIKFIIESKPKK